MDVRPLDLAGTHLRLRRPYTPSGDSGASLVRPIPSNAMTAFTLAKARPVSLLRVSAAGTPPFAIEFT